MPFPQEYQRATDQFYSFLHDIRDEAMYGSAHQAYTTAQAVLQVFRRRVSLRDGIRFAACLPVGLRALFVAEWDPEEPRRPFGTVEEMTVEAQELRANHNYVESDSISVVARVLWRHADRARLELVLASMEPAACEFWSAGSPASDEAIQPTQKAARLNSDGSATKGTRW
jgi:uncharacterized protein (DUF2267 family)